MTSWTIERPTADAWARVRDVRLRALADTPDAFGSTLAEEVTRPEEAWRTRTGAEDAVVFLAVAAGADVGIAFGAPFRGREGAAGLFGMWVEPAWRGRGVGGALVDAVVAWARGARWARLSLDVADGNAPAIALYASRGFAPTGVTGTLPPPREHILEHERSRDLRRDGARG